MGTWQSLVEKPSRQRPPREVSVGLGSDPVTKAVNGTRRLGVCLARVRRGRAGAPPPGRWGCGRSCRDRAAPLGPGSAWWVTRPAVSGTDLPQPRRTPWSLLVLNLTRTRGWPSVPCAPCPSSSRFRHVSDASAGGEARGRLGGSALHAAQGRARDACFPKAARTPLLGGGTLLSLEP